MKHKIRIGLMIAVIGAAFSIWPAFACTPGPFCLDANEDLDLTVISTEWFASVTVDNIGIGTTVHLLTSTDEDRYTHINTIDGYANPYPLQATSQYENMMRHDTYVSQTDELIIMASNDVSVYGQLKPFVLLVSSAENDSGEKVISIVIAANEDE